MSFLPPRQRFGESDLQWARRLSLYNSHQMQSIDRLWCAIVVLAPIALVLLAWRIYS